MGSKVIKSLIRCAALVAVLALIYSCTQEPFSEKHIGTGTEETVRVGLYTNAGDYQTPVSRASASEGYDANSMPWVFVFLGEDDNAVFAEVKRASMIGTNILPYVMLKRQSGPVRLLIVANAPETFFNGADDVAFNTDKLIEALTDKTFATAVNTVLNTARLVGAVNTVPYVSPQLSIPMSGVYNIEEGIDENTAVGSPDFNVNLTRVAAKVTVENSAVNFSLSAASVKGTNWYGRLYQTTPIVPMTGNKLIDYAEDIVSATGAAGKETTLNSPIYLYETASGETFVIVKGVYNGATYYYKLVFKNASSGSIMAIERNNWYKFTITSAATGYPSFADACNGLPSNIGYSITVVDQNAYDMTDNGRYYVGLSNSALEIVSAKDIDYEFTAVTVTTDATDDLIRGAANYPINAVSISGDGLLSCSATSLNLASGSAPGVTEIKIRTKASVATELGKITIRLGSITKEIVVRNSVSNNANAAPANLPVTTGKFTSAFVDPSSSSWLSFVIGNKNYTDYTNPVYNSNISFNFQTTPNIGSSNTRRVGTAYLTITNGGRTKYYVVQNALDPSRVERTLITSGYVGTFHRWNETGERVISMYSLNNAWSAVVISGDFIKLDTENASRNKPLTDNAEEHQLTGNAQYVIGTGNKIYFRVGLTGQLPSGSDAPRYGLILVTYNNNAHYHMIYVRQGEAPDYLMRNYNTEDMPTKGPMVGEQRTLAQKISPYNLTYSAGTSGRVGEATGTKYTFATYPSQGGYYFQWDKTYAWSPDGATTTNWLVTSSSENWEPNKALWESCPTGYRRATYGSTTTHVDPTTARTSEWSQSLWLNPLDGKESDVDNSTWGFLADGFFDRGAITMGEGGSAVSNTAVSPGTANVAYTGRLFYNPNNNASVFFPAAGYRNGETGNLVIAGKFVYFWSSSSHSQGSAWAASIEEYSVSQTNTYRNGGFPIRCVKNPTTN